MELAADEEIEAPLDSLEAMVQDDDGDLGDARTSVVAGGGNQGGSTSTANAQS